MNLHEGIYIDANYRLHYPKGKLSWIESAKKCFFLLSISGAKHLDILPEELNEVIDVHWKQYPPQHPMVVHMFGILFFCLWSVTFIANLGVLYVFFSQKENRTPVS